MRNLVAFLRRFQVFLLFVLMQVFALYTYFSYLNFPRAQYLTSASRVNGAILSVRNDLTKHFALSENNTSLQNENVRLRVELDAMKQKLSELDNAPVKVTDSVFNQQYTYIPATVINSTYTKANNFFTLNVGSLQGIKRNMGVFSDKGILGVIHSVSKNFSVVKSVLTENINIDVMIEPAGLFGLLKWDGKHPRRGQISGISNDQQVKRWSNVVTRGGSGLFPRGMMVGKVEKLRTVEGKPLWDVVVLFSENYRTLQRVYVIKNLWQKEQSELEIRVPGDEE
ncbi:MAG: rod shape-determining protein MreC [Bacteroidota bacterium]